MQQFNEHVGLEAQARFRSSTQEPSLPSTVHWRLNCATTGALLQDWTALTPIQQSDGFNLTDVYVDITIPGSLNVIQSESNSRELKTILVVSNKDLDSEMSEEFSYYVRNIIGR